MLGPEGVALLYVSPSIRPRLRLFEYGWHMVEGPGDYDRTEWVPAADATRFECGSPNMLGIHALEASLSLLQEVGIDAVQAAIGHCTARLIELVDARGFELLTPRPPERRAGIVSFRVPGIEQQTLYRRLVGQRLICAHRGGGIRFSPHFYTPEKVLKRAVELTAESATNR
jgi:selenocysteine lyase/cysteine desulfurase